MADFYDIYEKYNQWNRMGPVARNELIKSYMNNSMNHNYGKASNDYSLLNFLGEDWSKFEPVFTAYQDLMNGSSNDYLGFQNLTNQYGLGGAEFEKWLDNMISRQNTQEAWSQDQMMRDTSLLSSADQLAQLGLSSSGVLQTGGAATPNLSAAQNVRENVALQKLHERNQMTQNVLRMVGMLGSAGIHGVTLSRARRAASGLANITANAAFRYM